MLALPLSGWLQRRGIHFAWVVAAITFLTMLTSSAALGLPSVMMQPLSQEFGWDTAQISSALAVRFALFGLLGPFSALLMERFGVRAIVCTALTLIGAGLLLATQMTAFWQLVALWGVLVGVGAGMTALVLGAVVSTTWFETHRGLVVGLLTASSATGQMVFLPFAAWIIEHHGWRMAVLPVFACCALVVVLTFFFMRDHPHELRLHAFGADTVLPPPASPAAAARPLALALPFKVLAEASASKTFWILLATFFICGLSTNGLIQTHFISLCGDAGLGPVPAASVLAMMGAFDLVGTVLSGWLSDRYDSRKLLLWYYGLRGLSLLWLPHSDFTLYGLSLFAMFYGLDWIATVPPTVKLASAEFGERTGMVFGWVFAAHQLGAAVAAYGAGQVRILLLTYNPALYTAGAACLVAAAAVMLIRRQRSLA
ncbi:MFS transporter [Duganella callida]|uniref:MFS transporter n=1 Tax=Duganella callida TaxID=2561932 RepID=A0A4Y9SBH2_9BURK|nr:MFS transporter [Duganella callida]TFW19595.1 MFS transporter [Duganella callida]